MALNYTFKREDEHQFFSVSLSLEGENGVKVTDVTHDTQYDAIRYVYTIFM